MAQYLPIMGGVSANFTPMMAAFLRFTADGIATRAAHPERVAAQPLGFPLFCWGLPFKFVLIRNKRIFIYMIYDICLLIPTTT